MYENLALKVTKIRRGISFEERPWLKPYSQVPNKRGGQNKRGGGKFLKILINGGVKINGGGGNFPKNLINIYSTFRVQKHANNRR